MPKTRILVIEDDDDARMMYGIMLRSWGHEVAEATTGKDGLRIARQFKPDLILLDIMMPDIDGYEVCKQLRSDPSFCTVPIIFFSALDAVDDRIKGYTIGGDDFITKGQVEYQELGARIQAALNRVQRLKAEPRTKKQGSSVGLLSLRGGVGVSTLALNLARHAADWLDQPTLLLDLAFPVGSIGLWSGIEGTRHIAELLARNAAEINLPLIQSFSLQDMHGFSFIPAPSEIIDLSGIRPEALQRLLNVLRDEGYFIIMDLGRGTLPLQWHIHSQCNWLAVVTSADTTSRALASIAINTVFKKETGQRALLLIFNDATNAKPADISLGLPRTPDIFIPYTQNFQAMHEPSPLSQLLSIVTAP
ncbi:MAG TPA: response regulator [Anaerolineae bacterium]|nr:response regulator [Anaerolineae bacterium]HQH38111.1 response regulator [Anaerolineae bacterium]